MHYETSKVDIICFFQIRRAKRNILGLDPGPEEGGPGHVQDTGMAVIETNNVAGPFLCVLTNKLNRLDLQSQANQEQIKTQIQLEEQAAFQKPTQETHPLQRQGQAN